MAIANKGLVASPIVLDIITLINLNFGITSLRISITCHSLGRYN